jgi:hypothetical protein
MKASIKWSSLGILACGLVFASACGGDDGDDASDDGTGGTSGTGGTGGTSAGRECDPEGDGVCQNATDCPPIQDGTTASASSSCGFMCLGDDNREQCVTNCFMGAANTTAECSACYGALVDCAATNCLNVCGASPNSDECDTCQTEAGCDPAFIACSGLPE